MWKGKKRSTGKKYTYDPIGIGVCLRCRGRAGSGVPRQGTERKGGCWKKKG